MFRHVGMNDKKVLLKRFMSRQQFHYFTTILLRCLSLYFCGLIILVPHKSNLIRLKEKRIQLLKSSSFIDYQEHRKLFCNPRDFIKILYVISYTNGCEINFTILYARIWQILFLPNTVYILEESEMKYLRCTLSTLWLCVCIHEF